MSRKLALIIGNSEYDDPKLSQLIAPGKDAEKLGALLKSSDIGGFDETQILLNPSAAEARSEIGNFFLGKKRDDLFFFYKKQATSRLAANGFCPRSPSCYMTNKMLFRSPII